MKPKRSLFAAKVNAHCCPNFLQTLKVRLFFLAILSVAVSACAAATQVGSEANAPTLRLKRNFGYSSIGSNEIQGNFTLTFTGPASLQRVDFLLDSELMGIVEQAPFKLQFDTGSYPLGEHSLSATGYTADGATLQPAAIVVSFVSAEVGWQAAGKIAIPILVLVGGIMLLAFIVPLVTGGKKGASLPPGARRNYGLLGGAICPRCLRPFAVHLYGMNLLTHKLDRCPHCGRWSLVQRASPAELLAAEQAELAQAAQENEAPAGSPHRQAQSEEEKLRKALEDSKYER